MDAMYKVGYSIGWTNASNVDYNSWAISKIFRIGDIICMFFFFVSA